MIERVGHPPVVALHATAPESLDSYYQQVGRAGRDEEPAEITLFYRPEDVHLQTFLTASRAPEEALGEVATTLRDKDAPARPAELAADVEASAAKRTRAVNLLEQAGAVATTQDGALEYADPDLKPGQAVAEAVKIAGTQQRLVRSRIEMMRGCAETTACRRQFLLGYFGEELPHPCGNCDSCEGGASQNQAEDAPLPSQQRRPPLEVGPRCRDVRRTGPAHRPVRRGRTRRSSSVGRNAPSQAL